MCDADRTDMKLNDVWRALRKIQDAKFRYGKNETCAEFVEYDKNCTGLLSESLFTQILSKYRNIMGLSDHDIREVTDYFRLRDGRVAYRQFCKVVGESHDEPAPRALASGLEWNDVLHVNVLPRPEDRRQLCILLIKIAQTSHLPLRPFFQDYELVAQNCGLVTVSHFSRVLHFMKIALSDDEFLLLLKRYLKDAYTVNYVAFVKHIENITVYLRNRKLLDSAMKIINDFPGKLVDLDLPQLPPVSGVDVGPTIFNDICQVRKADKSTCEVITCLQKYVHQNRIRCTEFLSGFDRMQTGNITKNQFERGLHTMGVGHLLKQREFDLLCARYEDPIDSNRVMWKVFADEIDTVFTIKKLEKMPQLEVESPPKHIEKIPRPGARVWDQVSETTRNVCQEAMARIQNLIKNRRLHLHPFFRDYDKLQSGHVRCRQANQVFLINGILLTELELEAVLKRYGNELGFNYARFLNDVDPALYAVPQLVMPYSVPQHCKDAKVREEPTPDYIIKLLSNCKKQAVQRSIQVIEFLIDYDRHREGEILEVDFRRGLNNAGIQLEPKDINIICNTFRSPKRACSVLYRDFSNALETVFVTVESATGDQEYTLVPLQHLANLECFECFLNFEERTLCSQGLMKLARTPDEITNIRSIFKDFDKENCGTVRQNQLVRALTVRSLIHVISKRELDAIVKCFGVQRGLALEFNYREFLNILDMLFFTGQVKRFY